MTEPNNITSIIKPEIVAPPSVSNLSIAQVGTGMIGRAHQRMEPASRANQTVSLSFTARRPESILSHTGPRRGTNAGPTGLFPTLIREMSCALSM